MAVQILRICLIKRICSVGDSFRPASRATSLKEGGFWAPVQAPSPRELSAAG